jgi:copper chaperone
LSVIGVGGTITEDARPPAASSEHDEVPMTTRTYSVPGISCTHCRDAIESEVATVAGVETVQVDVDHRTVAVTGEPDDGAVRAAIDEAGYEVAGIV